MSDSKLLGEHQRVDHGVDESVGRLRVKIAANVHDLAVGGDDVNGTLPQPASVVSTLPGVGKQGGVLAADDLDHLQSVLPAEGIAKAPIYNLPSACIRRPAHTARPWIVLSPSPDAPLQIAQAGTFASIAELRGLAPDDEQLMNARVLAQSPTMLQLLRSVAFTSRREDLQVQFGERWLQAFEGVLAATESIRP